MWKFIIRAAAVGWIELIGIWLITQHHYMEFRIAIYLLMAVIAILWVALEILVETNKTNSDTDIKIAEIENTPTADDLLECMEDLAHELEKNNE